MKPRTKSIIVCYRRTSVYCDVFFHLTNGEKAALGNPPIDPEVEIIDIKINEVKFHHYPGPNTYITKDWLDSHPDWNNWLINTVLDTITEWSVSFWENEYAHF